MSCETETMAALRASGRRITPQRMMILTSLRHAGHTTAAAILQAVQTRYPYVDVSTVYRTLDVLKSMRLISETHLGGDEATFEWVGHEPHHHLVCQGCGAISEFDHRYLTTLVDALAHDVGFQANVDHLAIFGKCSACQERAPTS